MGNLQVTNAIKPLTAPNIILLTIEFLPHLLIILLSPWLTIVAKVFQQVQQMLMVYNYKTLLLIWNHAPNYMSELSIFEACIRKDNRLL